jgi:SAM-dependent MidA family methyltransferase
VSPPSEIVEQIVAEGGRVPFARFMELALAHPTEGYYAGSNSLLGPRGHFTTAPILSPEFNATTARLVEELVAASAAETPAAVDLIELGGGEGQLAKAVLGRLAGERPDLESRVTYTIVEMGDGLRACQRRALARASAAGRRVKWAPSLASAVAAGRAGPTIVMGNEFIDAMPVHLVGVSEDGVREAWVEVESAVAGGGGATLREVWDGPCPEAAAELRMLFGTEGAADLRILSQDGVIELRPAVGDLFRELTRKGGPSCLLTVDYGEWFGEGPLSDSSKGAAAGSTVVAPYQRTLRGYYRHQLVRDPYERVGAQDLTADVDFRALDAHGRAAAFETVLYTSVAAMLRGDSGAERLAELERRASRSLEVDRRSSALRMLLDVQGVGGAFKVMLQVSA